MTPYAFSLNNPIRFVDPDGNFPWDVTNAARSYMGTWYEWGGKNPFDIGGHLVNAMTGRLVGEMAYASWNMQGIVYPKNRYDFFVSKKQIYSINNLYVPKGMSVGIDCSGLSKISFNADPDTRMLPLPDGADPQLKAFETAQTYGLALLHSDFNQLKEGDLVFDNAVIATHVMVATGKLKIDKNGNVYSFEVIDAPGSGKQVAPRYLKTNSKWIIGHPFRYTDKLEKKGYGKMRVEYNKDATPRSPWSDDFGTIFNPAPY